MDCLAGGGDGAACRGRVRAPASRRSEQEQETAKAAVFAATAPPHASKQARPPGCHGRVNGRQRGRGSLRDAAPRQPQMCDMKNVVILKRGDYIAPEIRAALTVPAADQRSAAAVEKAGPVPTEDLGCAPAKIAERTAASRQCDTPEKKAEMMVVPEQSVAPAKMSEHVVETQHCISSAKNVEPVMAAEQSISPEENAEPVVAAEQSISPATNAEPVVAAEQSISPATNTKPVVATEQRITPADNAEPVVAAEQCIATAKNAELVAAADRRDAPATKANTINPVLYWGTSFAISPDPSVLPIPGFLLKPRGCCS
ncbi:hypothetical protein ABZP36_036267 [Zizania latifolia]